MRGETRRARLGVPHRLPTSMRTPIMILAIAGLVTAAHPALCSSFAGSSAGTSAGGTSASSGSTSGDDKVVLAARTDAARFVATDGAIRGAMLEAALRHLREHDPLMRARSDMRLAQAILAL